jgi:hypothetical protein
MANSVYAVAVIKDVIVASKYEITTAGPACSCAAAPVKTNTPAPTTPPMPKKIKSNAPNSLFNDDSLEEEVAPSKHDLSDFTFRALVHSSRVASMISRPVGMI